MPLLAKLLGSLAAALASFFSIFWSYHVALKLASYTAWIAVLGSFLTSVLICLNALYGLVVSATGGGGGGEGGYMAYFWMALGVFIPSNAAAVISCIASVWVASSLYKIKKQGIHTYGA